MARPHPTLAVAPQAPHGCVAADETRGAAASGTPATPPSTQSTPSARRPPRATRKALPVIDPARCTGCGWCAGVCPPHVLSLHTAGGRKTSTLDDAAGCTGCALCALRCPFDAIAMRRRVAAGGAQRPDRPSQSDQN